jgi:hypothetical protein
MQKATNLKFEIPIPWLNTLQNNPEEENANKLSQQFQIKITSCRQFQMLSNDATLLRDI